MQLFDKKPIYDYKPLVQKSIRSPCLSLSLRLLNDIVQQYAQELRLRVDGIRSPQCTHEQTQIEKTACLTHTPPASHRKWCGASAAKDFTMKCTLIFSDSNTRTLRVEFGNTAVNLPYDQAEEVDNIIGSNYATCYWNKDFTRLYNALLPMAI